MKNRARKLLMNLGVNPALSGYDYLVEAVNLCCRDRKYRRNITKELYPYLAKQNQTTTSCVERAIRYAIEKAFQMCPDMPQSLLYVRVVIEKNIQTHNSLVLVWNS